VSMKDAHKVAVDLIDRKKELDKLTVDDGPTEARDDDKLEKLAERFAEMATKSIENNLNKRRTVDAEIVDAVHDEREAGLQERVRQVPFQARTNQEPDGENDGPEAS
jgi:hypothetical protein